MKVIVVDDEPNSLTGMRRAIESLGMNLSLFTASHAEEAMAIIEEQRPDLIVTDIMLPGMTGLDLIEYFVGENYQPKVIVVSGFDDFQYAQRCIRFGAVDYLLKPFDTEEFAEKIRKSLHLIQQEKQQLGQLQQQNAFAQMGNRLMRDNYLTDFCLKFTPLEDHIYQRLKLWDLDWLADQSYSIIAMDAKGYPEGKPMGRNFTLQTFVIGNILNEVLLDYAQTVFFKDPKQRWVVITGNNQPKELSHSIIHIVKSYQNIELAAGISTKMALFEHIHFAYLDALKTFRIHSLSDHSEFLYESGSSGSIGYATADEMASFICEQNEGAISRAVNDFVRQAIMQEGTESRRDMIRVLLNYLSEIHVSLSEKTTKELEEIPMSVWETFDGCSTIQEYEQVLQDYLMNLSRQLFAPKMNAIVERTLEKMAASYMQDITLSKVADELSIHPVWLSQVFKKETGHTYTDYLADLRINRAKTLLRETSMKIYEIAVAVGYNDLQHFGSLFKKKTGETPKEFRYGK
jgi:two-component system, response regulator YesN